MTPTPPPDATRQRVVLARLRRTLLALGVLVTGVVWALLYLPRFQDTAGFLQERRYGSPGAAEVAPLLLGATLLPALGVLATLVSRSVAASGTARWRWSLLATGTLAFQSAILLGVAAATPDRVDAHRFLLWGTLALVLALIPLHRHLGRLQPR